MKPRITPVIAVCLAVIAGGVVRQWMRGDESPAADWAVEARSGKASQREESRPGGKTAMEPEEAAVGEPDQLVVQGLETASQVFERTSRQLVTDFELSAAQTGKLEEVFAGRGKQLKGLLAGDASGDGNNDGEVFAKTCALLRNKGLRDDLTGVLSPRQLAAFDAREAKRERETIEARAYRDLAELNAVVSLTDPQKQEVFGAFMKHAPAKVENEADARALMAFFYGPMAADMNPADIRNVTNLMNMNPAGTPDIDPGGMEHLRRIEQQKAERIDHEIATLQVVLDEGQLARYREHLENQPP